MSLLEDAYGPSYGEMNEHQWRQVLILRRLNIEYLSFINQIGNEPALEAAKSKILEASRLIEHTIRTKG